MGIWVALPDPIDLLFQRAVKADVDPPDPRCWMNLDVINSFFG